MINIPAHKDVIVIHCLATKPKWGKNKSIAQIIKEVTRWHVEERGWSDIGYAAVIGCDGIKGNGRDLNDNGNVYDDTAAAAKGWNKRGIHIALVGGFGGNADDIFSDHFTSAQEKSLLDEIEIIQKLSGRKMRVAGHNEFAAKACPCFDVPSWYMSARHGHVLMRQTAVPKPKPTPTLPQWLRRLLGR